jgi:hypothetical protein
MGKMIARKGIRGNEGSCCKNISQERPENRLDPPVSGDTRPVSSRMTKSREYGKKSKLEKTTPRVANKEAMYFEIWDFCVMRI